MKIKQLIILGFLLLNLQLANACSCMEIDSASAKELLEEVEIIIIGQAVQNADFNPEVRANWDRRNKGLNVVFKVDSVLKGCKELKEVILNQFSNGNCGEYFKFGQQYLILGTRLLEFVNKTPEQVKFEKGVIPIEYPSPPPSSILNSKMLCFNNSQEEVDYWEQLAKYNIVLFTSQCSSFSMNGKSANYFFQ